MNGPTGTIGISRSRAFLVAADPGPSVSIRRDFKINRVESTISVDRIASSRHPFPNVHVTPEASGFTSSGDRARAAPKRASRQLEPHAPQKEAAHESTTIVRNSLPVALARWFPAIAAAAQEVSGSLVSVNGFGIPYHKLAVVAAAVPGPRDSLK